MRGKFVSFLTAAVVLTVGALVVSAPARAQQTFQSVIMQNEEGIAPEKGAATLTRSADEIWLTISAQGLDKKAAYTVWWVVFNNPGECVGDPCGLGDLFEGDVDGSVFYATGFVTGTDGTANVTAHLPSGEIADGVDVVVGIGGILAVTEEEPELGAGNGLLAEVHVILRTHSATIEGLVNEQIGGFLGACDQTFCEDQHFFVFPPIP